MQRKQEDSQEDKKKTVWTNTELKEVCAVFVFRRPGVAPVCPLAGELR